MPVSYFTYFESHLVQPRRFIRFLSVMLLLSISMMSGCGARVGGLCDEAVDCGYIQQDDESECRSDLHNAVSDGDIGKNDVDKCLHCMRDNDCGIDTVVDCSEKCAAVAPYVGWSIVH